MRIVTDAAQRTVSAIVDALLPQTCAGCGGWIPGYDGVLCATCRARLADDATTKYCRRCGRTLPSTAIHSEHCARCRTEHYWNIRGIARLGRYEEPLRRLVCDLKYGGALRNASILADLLVAQIRNQPWADQIDGIVPVPMHRLRRWQRPCDHARVLGEAVAARLHVPVVPLVRRVQHRPSQTTLQSRHQRFENVAGCFGLPRWTWQAWLPFGGVPHKNRTLCIIDNLLMSGATIYEVAKVLHKVGVRRVYAAVLARPAAPGDPPAEALALEYEADGLPERDVGPA